MRHIMLAASFLVISATSSCRTVGGKSDTLANQNGGVSASDSAAAAAPAAKCPETTKLVMRCLPTKPTHDNLVSKIFAKEILICSLDTPEEGFEFGLLVQGQQDPDPQAEIAEPLFAPVKKVTAAGNGPVGGSSTLYVNSELKISLKHLVSGINPNAPIASEFQFVFPESENSGVRRMVDCMRKKD